MMILPRQARDKHRENSKKDRFVADIAAPLAHLSHPGGFSDLDSLEVGVPAPILVDAESGQPSSRCSNFCPSTGVRDGMCTPVHPAQNVTMSLDEQKSMMAIWCMTNSMLIAGNDLRTMDSATREILTAKGPISVNQVCFFYFYRPLGLKLAINCNCI
jgi:hypothetical protein